MHLLPNRKGSKAARTLRKKAIDCAAFLYRNEGRWAEKKRMTAFADKREKPFVLLENLFPASFCKIEKLVFDFTYFIRLF